MFYRRAGQMGEAIDSLRKALTLAPQGFWFHYVIGLALLANGEPAAALAALNHRNIVTLHSVDEANGLHLLTM